MDGIESIILGLIAAAMVAAPVITGIMNVLKKHTNIHGIWIIVTAISVGVALFGSVALVFSLPLAHSLLLGVLSGWGSVGAFETIEHAKEGR